ncbi:2,3-bisphosphoglycerate-independent phosphoglycerate mutase [bacterium]|nr:2,3-bisphosphoglycerate-independent phosphoglycerate mutase [bacterium]MBU1615681.1 2,3-bisphosphoglycerate-independent phosphoglycerate mutase [bacterium]
MDTQQLLKELSVKTDSKIILLVIDGLGGLPVDGQTELEKAATPNLDALAAKSVCGLSDPISPGITPGSGPAHLALFGYDPLSYKIGRGVLDTLGISFKLEGIDIAARGNFCTADKQGIITDRRAGRISTEENEKICQFLSGIQIDGVEIFVKPVKEHRCAVIFRGEGLYGDVADTDSQKVGLKPLPAKALTPDSEKTARIANKFIDQAKERLKNSHPANMIVLRGFDKFSPIPTFGQIYKLTPAAIATYPMYKGLARLVGMEILEAGQSIEEEIRCLKENWPKFDFFYLHIKGTDSRGEDGDFEGKVKVIEELDGYIPEILDLSPDVIVVTADHSTPAKMASHSWHPVPLLLYSDWVRKDRTSSFGETECILGALGRLKATDVLPLALANAGKLIKYGA